jgi:CubicO group peptidase (beta-lactamase class C family)
MRLSFSLSIAFASNLLSLGSSRRLSEENDMTGILSANGDKFKATNCLDDQLGQALQANGIPGANPAILRKGQIVYEQGYGTRDPLAPSTQARSAHQQGTTPYPSLASTPFRIMSISKSITSLTTLLLAQDELLNLDDLVFAEGGVLNHMMAGHDGADPRIADIMIRHLLQHSAGFPTQLVPGDPTSDPSFSGGLLLSKSM